MAVLLTRVATALPGRHLEAIEYAKASRDTANRAYALHAEVYVRIGGPVGQVGWMESYEDLAALEQMKRASYQADDAHGIPRTPLDTFKSMEEFTWIKL